MTDNNIRCALAFRLEGKTVTCLAAYKHDPKHEKKFADSAANVIGKNPPRASSTPGKIGGFENVIGNTEQYVYGADKDGLCLAVITGQKYPSRVAIQMLTELHEQFRTKFGSVVPKATANSLTRKSKSMMSSICKKYEDFSNVDKAQALIGKVDEVKGQMHTNVAKMLANSGRASDMAAQGDHLTEQASVFKKKSVEVKRQMGWKSMKMNIILVLIVVGILLVIFLPIIIRLSKESKMAQAPPSAIP
mmetsp:Transcript_9099/g.11207  ORF Transcript_9099/g.11207 Transcript_9099/m.11207 type:complete len:247 (+) Transcript_9099:162-902(+)|eukprot:CAMPEP_0172496706 /NCGR_PEP_ID=MMETSP1066-20121228/91635_1 /TAXON_ID=671091 /ORGANISM="Coscinodiscus wailesii, Strain CCMP2513" /LENGTH=246 /DNA_ID=CAMNT_0013269133 /DNA_START=149 /DNA_END=889 /DNA_ORIENTATION=+